MANLIIDEELAKRLQIIAERERRPIDDVLRTIVATYETYAAQPVEPPDEDLLNFLGAFDDEVADLSSSVRETMKEYYQKKYARTD